jgi:uncharacterized delta-60 repeat protein
MRTLARPFFAMAFASAFLLGSAIPVAASAGELDDTFDVNGKRVLDFSAGNDFFTDVAIQPGDQKIVAVGGSDPADGEWLIVRFNPDGTLDSGFGGGDGIVRVDFSSGDDYANAVALQADGTIVVVGLASGSGGRWGVVRLNSGGTLDGNFSGDGKLTMDFTTGEDLAGDVAIQASDEKIVISGWTAANDSRFVALRLMTDGLPDPTFGGDGIASANLTSGRDLAVSLGITSTGKVVVGGLASGSGGQIGLVRFNPGGGLDPTFSGDGRLTQNFSGALDVAYGVVIQPADNKIVLAGESGGANSKMLAMRFNTNGTPDSTFSGDGRILIDITDFRDSANSLALQDDGSIVLAGSANFEFYTVIRLTAGGSLDSSFGDDGVMFANLTAKYDVALSVAIQADGGIVAVGQSGGGGGSASAARFLGS